MDDVKARVKVERAALEKAGFTAYRTDTQGPSRLLPPGPPLPVCSQCGCPASRVDAQGEHYCYDCARDWGLVEQRDI